MMRSEIVKKFVAMIGADAQKRRMWRDRVPSPCEFEMACQARVAGDRIRFALKATEMSREESGPLKEAAMQLLDGLDRLEAAERGFQDRWQSRNHSKPPSLDFGAGHATKVTARAAS